MWIRRLSSFIASAIVHGLALLLLALLPSPPPGTGEPSRDAGGTARNLVVASVELPPTSGDQVVAPDGNDDKAEEIEGVSLRVAGFDFDIATIKARRQWLFPFVTTDFLFLERADRDIRDAAPRLVGPHTDAATPKYSSRPPLALSDAELQAIIDRSWSRRERWKPFSEIAALVDRHDPQDGRVPALLRAYLDQNLLQPYHDPRIRDPRFWAMLSCAADHVEFVDWIRSFTRQHPSSRTTTELLFLLDEFAQASRDTLAMLLATNPEADLQYTRKASPGAYDLAVSLRRQYADRLARHEIVSAREIRRRYDEVRLRILSTIVKTSPDGFRTADAQFLAGEILFNRNDLAGAVRLWRDMRPAESDSYLLAASEILGELRSPGGPRAVEIHRILGTQYRRWLDFSRDRLAQFGHSFDTF